MTKYVLNSGGISNFPDRKSLFHKEIVKNLSANPKILLCNFAQPREYWEVKYEGYKDSIKEDLEGVNPDFKLAFPDKFVKQCEWSDVIYIHGGDDYLIQFWMQKFDLEKLFENKVVATNSGSSDMMSVSFWPSDWRRCVDGLGILQIKFIPHFGSASNKDDIRGDIDWLKAKEELKNYGDKGLPIFALEEGEFVVFEDKTEVKI